MLIKETISLLKKEILLEWKQKYAFGGILLYVASTVFISYLSFRTIIDVSTWNALFWIIMLFAAVNAVAKSFMQESSGRLLFFYTLASSRSIIISKIIYNSLLLVILAFICLLFYSTLIGNLIQDLPMFLCALFLGSLGLSTTLTLISAIASKTNGNLTLMAILGFPVIVPLLMTVIRFSKNAIDGISWGMNYKYVIILLLLNLIVVILSYLLFPYLWQD